VRRLALIGAVLFLSVGCGGDEDLSATGPGAAEVKVIENLYDGHYERAWADLHPTHQKVVTQKLFAYCAQQVTAVGEIEQIEVLDVFDDDAKIPLLAADAETKAVRVRVTSFSGESFVDVDHLVKVGDRWRWVLNQKSIVAYRRGRCPR